MENEKLLPQVIIIGGGLTGLRAALEAAKSGVKAFVFSKVHPLRSHSVAAQGGVNVALGNNAEGREDSWELHTRDTIKGGDFLNDQDATALMCKEGIERIIEIEHWGCPFSRTEEGRIAQRPFGGGTFPRTAYAADRTGHALLNTLYEQCIRLKSEGLITFHDEWHVVSVIASDAICYGVIAYNLKTREVRAVISNAVIIATGGAGRIYRNSTNALINTGMGMSLGYLAGAPLKDMEFIQFHPTTLYGSNILISEGSRGEGGFLINKYGKRYLAEYPDSAKAMEMAPRDIIARNTVREIQKGNGFDNSYVLLDLRHLGGEKIEERLPGIRELSIKFAGIDPIENPIPVQPGQHYTMGGIDVNINTETNIKGLYAAGEAACVSVHGANRLGGNSLLETIVFGAIAGRNASEYAKGDYHLNESIVKEHEEKETERLSKILSSNGEKTQWDIWNALQATVMEKVGIFREKNKLKEALENIRGLINTYKDIGLTDKGRSMNMELYWAVELHGSLLISEALVMGALSREESRGSHFREDFPQRDDENFLKHTIVSYNNGSPALGYKDVDTSIMKPEERKY
ncbi:MAG: FAD-binding protein [Nitrospirae bacterium]|nr:FAD-binding protein [Nitrospirota bacterium]